MRFRKGLGASGEDHQNPDHKRGTAQAPNPRQSGAPNKQTRDHGTDARSRKGGERGPPRRGDEERRGRSASRNYEERRGRSASRSRDARTRNDRDVPSGRNTTNYDAPRPRDTRPREGGRSGAPNKRPRDYEGERHDRGASRPWYPRSQEDHRPSKKYRPRPPRKRGREEEEEDANKQMRNE